MNDRLCVGVCLAMFGCLPRLHPFRDVKYYTIGFSSAVISMGFFFRLENFLFIPTKTIWYTAKWGNMKFHFALENSDLDGIFNITKYWVEESNSHVWEWKSKNTYWFELKNSVLKKNPYLKLMDKKPDVCRHNDNHLCQLICKFLIFKTIKYRWTAMKTC